MTAQFIKYFPNLVTYREEFIKALFQTLEMVIKSGVIAFIIGLILGVLLVVTRKDGILENKYVHVLLNHSTNLVRSIPFVILITTIMPITRFIVGTPLGVKGAIFPLVVGCVPFFMRQVDLALSELDYGLLEAAISMGISPMGIIIRVYLKECIPSLIRATTITFISLIGLSAMAGIVGGGGLGDFVTRYGHGRYMYDITFISVLVILLLVNLIQGLGNLFIKYHKH